MDNLDPKTIIALDAKYPVLRWWVRVGEEGDFAGPGATPAEAIAKALGQYFVSSLDELLPDWGDEITVGMWTEDVILLDHLNQLVRFGINVVLAQAAVEDLQERLAQALNTASGEEAYYGWTPVYDVEEGGQLVERVQEQQ